MTAEGAAYLTDVVRRDDEVLAQLTRNAEQSGEMTEVQREMAQIELIFFGLSRDMSREGEAVLEASDPVAARKAMGLEEGLLRDEEWDPLDGEVCLATAFTPFPDPDENQHLPYAAIEIESPALTEPTTGYITNQLDFENLTEAFGRCSVDGNEEVIVVWSKSRCSG